MSIENITVVDGAAILKDNKGLALLIADHLDWQEELYHLELLQDKINNYLMFIESEQYKEIFPEKEIKYVIIEIRFLHDVSENCTQFLETVKKQLNENGIELNYIVTGDQL